MADCSDSSTPVFTMQRQTTWDSASIGFPFPLAGTTAKIDFIDYETQTVVLSINSAPSVNSRIEIDEDTDTVFPIVTAEDSELFLVNKIYVFDVAIIDGDDVKRSGKVQLNIEPSYTDAL